MPNRQYLTGNTPSGLQLPLQNKITEVVEPSGAPFVSHSGSQPILAVIRSTAETQDYISAETISAKNERRAPCSRCESFVHFVRIADASGLRLLFCPLGLH
jgi:hypothetical protein